MSSGGIMVSSMASGSSSLASSLLLSWASEANLNLEKGERKKGGGGGGNPELD